MSNLETLRTDFDRDWNSIGVYHGKGLITDLPSWEDVLNILNAAARDKDPQINQYIKSSQQFEVIYKDMLAIKTLKYDDEDINLFNIESDATFFFSLFFSTSDVSNKISPSISNQIDNMNIAFDIDTDFSSLKISLSEKFVPYESHEWHTCIIHLKGTNNWNLRDNRTGMQKLYVLEAGDCLFFKEGIEHELSNEKPRSSLVGRFTLGDSHE